MLASSAPGSRVEITGDWITTGENTNAREVIKPRSARKLAASTDNQGWRFTLASLDASNNDDELGSNPLTPIRTTSPGLTVYKGGAIVTRFYYTRQHLGGVKVDRQAVRVNVSYTPTPTVQLEAEIPYSHTSFDDGVHSGSSQGFGNLTLWGKYRFFRKLETWGDRQAAARFGLEFPTGKKDGPAAAKLPTPAFVRKQLTPIAGGLSAHSDVSYSQAKRRFVYGANIEGILRSERAGFRLGNEVRINTDLEYVLLPLNYRSPTHELFLIFETTYVHRGSGRVGGGVVPDTTSTEFYLAGVAVHSQSAIPGRSQLAASRYLQRRAAGIAHRSKPSDWIQVFVLIRAT